MAHLVTLAILSAICIQAFEEQPKNATNIRNLAEATNSMGLQLYQKLRTKENLFMSPASIGTAMGMLYLGARGTSAEELRNALGYNAYNLEDRDINNAFKDLSAVLKESPKNYQLDAANAVLVQSDTPVLENYLNGLREYYDAVMRKVDFRDGEATKDEVNRWVNEKTHGQIKQLLEEPLDSLTRMLLLNVIHFKGWWLTEFDSLFTRNRTFHNQGTDGVDVPTMLKSATFPYADFPPLDCKVLELPYKGKDISMIVVLPNSYTGISELGNNITPELLNQMIDQLSNETVRVFLPKFKLECNLKLKPALKGLGIRSVFTHGADLNGITASNELFVEDVLHKAVVEVNEEGTEASAATGVVIMLKKADFLQTIFYADHPFLFFIRDNRYGMILFMGEINTL